jgi:hypothetical protein
MAYEKENIFHCMGLLYLTVAYLPDQEVSNAEKAEMAERLTRWLKAFDYDVNEDGVIDNDDAAQIFLGDVLPFFSEISTEDLVEEVHRICGFLISQSFWDEDISLELLKDLYSVAIADDKLLKSANYVIDTAAKALKIIDNEDVKIMLERMNNIAID